MSFRYSNETQQALNNLAKARQTLAEQRKDAEDKKIQTLKQLQELQTRKDALPNYKTQEALRSSKFNTLKGRALKQDVKTAEGKFGVAIGDTEQFKQAVETYESDLNKYETEQLKPYESAVSSQAKEERSFDLAQRFYDRRVPIKFVDDPVTRKYLKEFYKQGAMNREAFARDVDKLQETLPSGEKLVVDYSKMKIKGVESGQFQQSFNIEGYNKKIQELQSKYSKLPTISQSNSVLKSNIDSLKGNQNTFMDNLKIAPAVLFGIIND